MPLLSPLCGAGGSACRVGCALFLAARNKKVVA